MLNRETASGVAQSADLLEVRPVTQKIPPYLFRIAVLWGCVLAGLFFALIAYGTTPGPSDLPPAVAPLRQIPGIPSSSTSSQWEVVMAVHPKCPCTVASINELSRLVIEVGKNVRCHFLVFHPADSSSDWIDGTISSRLSQFPHSTIQADEASKAALELGMQTSGAVILFDPLGNPRFHGGITVSRNHEGDNLGVRSISMLIQGRTPPLNSTPVYGCRL